MPVGACIYLFKEGVKPEWEDAHNVNGGSFVLRFEKSKVNRLWEDVLLALISAKAETLAEISGVRVKVRKELAEIDFWVGSAEEAALESCRRWIITITGLENETPIEFIPFYSEQ